MSGKSPKTKKSITDYQTIDFLKVTPPGFEPRSKEPESSILSIKLWGRNLRCKGNNILLTEAMENTQLPLICSEWVIYVLNA